MLQEDKYFGFVSKETLEVLNTEVVAKFLTEDNNLWYRNGRHIMIISTQEIKNRFNAK